MEFENDRPILNYYQDWEINPDTGAWREFDLSRNLAANKAVTASSADDAHVAKHVTDLKTFTDYVDTYWQSDDNESQWIRVDLEKPIEINRVILKWNTNAAKTFKIQTSTDATHWTDVFSTNLGASYTVTDETFETTTSYGQCSIAHGWCVMPVARRETYGDRQSSADELRAGEQGGFAEETG